MSKRKMRALLECCWISSSAFFPGGTWDLSQSWMMPCRRCTPSCLLNFSKKGQSAWAAQQKISIGPGSLISFLLRALLYLIFTFIYACFEPRLNPDKDILTDKNVVLKRFIP